MTTHQLDFLNIISDVLNGTNRFVGYDNAQDWQELYDISVKQSLIPLVYDKASAVKSFKNAEPTLETQWSYLSIQNVAKQINQTLLLNEVCAALSENNIPYIVLKGVSCRRYYDNPNFRPSGDEDVLIPNNEYRHADAILKNMGYKCLDDFSDEQSLGEREVRYIKSDLILEIHLNPFGKQNKRDSVLDDKFYDAFDHRQVIELDGSAYDCFDSTRQLKYLFAHFYHHFYDKGVGVRQMVDTLLCMEKEKDIDWQNVNTFLTEINMKKLFAAIINAGEKYFEMNLSFVPKYIRDESVNPDMLLDDMFEGGVFGFGDNAHASRLGGFSNLDLDGGTRLSIIFPNIQRLGYHYPNVFKYPFLYPFYLVCRWFNLLKKYAFNKNGRGLLIEARKIGKSRKEILEKYH